MTRDPVRAAVLGVRRGVLEKLREMRGRWEYDTKSNIGNIALREAMSELTEAWREADRKASAKRGARG